MSKRVHEIAKEHDLPAGEVLERLRDAGMNIKSVSSGVEEDAALKILGIAAKPKTVAAAKPAARPNGNGSAGRAASRAGAPPAADAPPAGAPPAEAPKAKSAKPSAARPPSGDASAAAPARAAAKPSAPARAAAKPSAAPAGPAASAPTPGNPPAPARTPLRNLRRVAIDGPGSGSGGRGPRSGPSRSTPARGGETSGSPLPPSPIRPPVPRDIPIPVDPRSNRADTRPDPRSAAARGAQRGPARDPRSGQAARDPRSGQAPRDPRQGQAQAPPPRDQRANQASRDAQARQAPLESQQGLGPRDPRGVAPRETRAGQAARGPRTGQGPRDARGAGQAPRDLRPALGEPRPGSGDLRSLPRDPRAGQRPATAGQRPAATGVQPAAAAGNPQDAAAAPGAAPAAGAEAKQRPTRDSLQGERAPGAAAGGGRRRVVIDSQASRRAPGQGGPANQPPRRQRRGRRRRGVYDDEVESRATNALTPDMPKDVIRINSGSTAKDVAEYLSVSVAEVMTKLITLGELRTVTQTLPDETIEVLAAELEKEVEIVHTEDEVGDEPVYEDAEDELMDRPPVVTIMGHVDHGKTSLLDAIRQTEVAAGEAGGITQHIGAYQVHHDGRTITFLDTPGHEAFTAMRARGARVTDLAVIVVAADDGVKPQTQEAVDHAKEAEVPVLVAVNKIDKEGADPARVRTEMTGLGLQPVEWGGEIEFVDVSARTKDGLDTLLETILVMAEVEELKANPNTEASGTVIESKLDPGRGPVVTILIERGTLKVGDALVAGAHWGRVRAMNDFTGSRTTQAKPGEPVEVLGFDGVPEAGEHVRVVDHERRARQLAAERATRLKSESLARRSNKKISLEDIAGGEVNELNLVVKADVAGSLEAIEDEIAKLPQDEVSVNVIRRAVGGVTESDVMLAAASDAVVLAFNVRPVGEARAVAEREGIEIRGYSVIYRAIEDLRQAMEGMLAPEEVEDSLGTAEVRQIFRASRVGTIAGSYVTDGKITRGSKVRLVRDGTVVYTGEIASLRRFNEDAREVASGFECGIVLRDYADLKEGDVLEAYATRQVERELVS